LTESLIISSIPIVETGIPEAIFLFPFFFSKCDRLDTRQIASVLGL
jgi:hypothetical protein